MNQQPPDRSRGLSKTRFPVLLEEFAIRRGSGGIGRWRGGDGAVRRLRFAETHAMHRRAFFGTTPLLPFGLAGGGEGEPEGINLRLEKSSGGDWGSPGPPPASM